MLGVSRRTISRDLESLSVFPIAEVQEGIDVFYELMRGARAPNVRFEAEELVALLLGKRTMLSALDGTPYADAVAAAFTKIELLQRESSRRALARLPDVFQSSFSRPRVHEGLRERLIEAALGRRRVRIDYTTAERQARGERVVEPYFLHLHPHGLHLIAYCLKRQEFLYFSVNAIESMTVLDEVFDPERRSFDLEAFLATVFDGQRGQPVVDVHLRVCEPTASWARDHHYHSSQKIIDVDGGVDIHFRSGAPRAVVARILSLGPDCEVLAPLSIRRAVARQAAAIAQRYTKD